MFALPVLLIMFLTTPILFLVYVIRLHVDKPLSILLSGLLALIGVVSADVIAAVSTSAELAESPYLKYVLVLVPYLALVILYKASSNFKHITDRILTK